jgi:hypothetical protein
MFGLEADKSNFSNFTFFLDKNPYDTLPFAKIPFCRGTDIVAGGLNMSDLYNLNLHLSISQLPSSNDRRA